MCIRDRLYTQLGKKENQKINACFDQWLDKKSNDVDKLVRSAEHCKCKVITICLCPTEIKSQRRFSSLLCFAQTVFNFLFTIRKMFFYSVWLTDRKSKHHF